MSLISVAILGIVLSLLILLMGVLLESRSETETAWIKGKQPVKRGFKKPVARLLRRKTV
jgi:hypothetical protein